MLTHNQIADFLGGDGDWFTAKLVRLIAKADSENRERLRQGFPDEVAAYEDYAGINYLRKILPAKYL